MKKIGVANIGLFALTLHVILTLILSFGQVTYAQEPASEGPQERAGDTLGLPGEPADTIEKTTTELENTIVQKQDIFDTSGKGGAPQKSSTTTSKTSSASNKSSIASYTSTDLTAPPEKVVDIYDEEMRYGKAAQFLEEKFHGSKYSIYKGADGAAFMDDKWGRQIACAVVNDRGVLTETWTVSYAAPKGVKDSYLETTTYYYASGLIERIEERKFVYEPAISRKSWFVVTVIEYFDFLDKSGEKLVKTSASASYNEGDTDAEVVVLEWSLVHISGDKWEYKYLGENEGTIPVSDLEDDTED